MELNNLNSNFIKKSRNECGFFCALNYLLKSDKIGRDEKP